MNRWVWADAWFLASALGSRRNTGKTLDQVIATGDYINKAIFNKDEIENAVRKLRAAGLVKVEGSRFLVTSKVAHKVARRLPALQAAEQLEEWLATLPLPSDVEPFVISDEEFQDAVETYGLRFRKWYEKVSEPKLRKWFSLKKW